MHGDFKVGTHEGGVDRDVMTKSQLKKSILKFRQYYEAKRVVGPNKTA